MMIKYSEIEKEFDDVGIKVNEYNIELNDEEISTPFVVYTATDGDSFNADGQNYMNFLNVGLALIDETLNFTMQRQIEAVFDSTETGYDKVINFDDEARLYTITYQFTAYDDAGYEI